MLPVATILDKQSPSTATAEQQCSSCGERLNVWLSICQACGVFSFGTGGTLSRKRFKRKPPKLQWKTRKGVKSGKTNRTNKAGRRTGQPADATRDSTKLTTSDLAQDVRKPAKIDQILASRPTQPDRDQKWCALQNYPKFGQENNKPSDSVLVATAANQPQPGSPWTSSANHTNPETTAAEQQGEAFGQHHAFFGQQNATEPNWCSACRSPDSSNRGLDCLHYQSITFMGEQHQAIQGKSADELRWEHLRFGASSPAATEFGALSPAATGFGAATGYGASSPAETGFSASSPAATGFSASTGFGALSPAATGFGALAPAATGFGALSPAATGFGASSPAATGFSASTGFGALSPAATGLGAATGFGALSPAATRFGASSVSKAQPTRSTASLKSGGKRKSKRSKQQSRAVIGFGASGGFGVRTAANFHEEGAAFGQQNATEPNWCSACRSPDSSNRGLDCLHYQSITFMGEQHQAIQGKSADELRWEHLRFGASSPAATGFGALSPAATGFGAATGYGASSPAATGFGASSPAATGFSASSPAATGFSASTGFGASSPAATGFGASLPAGGIFGASASMNQLQSTPWDVFAKNANAGNSGTTAAGFKQLQPNPWSVFADHAKKLRADQQDATGKSAGTAAARTNQPQLNPLGVYDDPTNISNGPLSGVFADKAIGLSVATGFEENTSL